MHGKIERLCCLESETNSGLSESFSAVSAPSEPPIAKSYPTSRQPIRRSATAALHLGRRFGRTPSQCLLSSVCRADPTIRGESGQRPKVQAGAVASLACRSLGVKEAQRQSAARKRPRGRPNQSFRLEILARLAQSRLGAPLPCCP